MIPRILRIYSFTRATLVLVCAINDVTSYRKDESMEPSRHRTMQQMVLPEGVTSCEPENDATAPSYRTAGSVSIFSTREHAFCMNGGFCKANYTEDFDNPCECLEEFAGPHCEFIGNVAPGNCTRSCQNDGICKIGAPSWTDALHEAYYNVSASDLQYCSCTPHYFGNFCEFAFDDFNGLVCGENSSAKLCLNGGTCVKTFGSNFTSIEYNCDCTTANVDGIDRAGLYCEHESTTTCGDDHNGIQFCVNGGSCKSQSHLGCNCPPGFVGPICEFKDLEMKPKECRLDCMNQGICRKGAKDIAILEKLGLYNDRFRRLVENEKYNDDFEHCVCPSGFVGLRCEHQLDICPGGEHGCLNGGDCRTTMKDGHIHFECDCISAVSSITNQRYAGSFCEMESTQFCTLDGTMPLGGPPVKAFCTNGGSCKKLINATSNEQHEGCNCPNGFDGENCEYLTDSSTGSDETNGGSLSQEYIIIGLLSGVALILCFLCVASLYSRRRKISQIKGDNFDNVDPYDKRTSRPVMDLIAFGSDEDGPDPIFDDVSCSSSKASHSTKDSNSSSKRRTTKRLKKLKKKRFSTMDRTIVDVNADDIPDDSTPTIANISETTGNDRDGLLLPKEGSKNMICATTKSTPSWPNSIRNPTDTASIFNEIDLGDDYGINLIT